MLSAVTLALGAVRRFAARWRVPLLVVAVAAFVGGGVISIRALGLDGQTFDWRPLGLSVAVLAPVTLCLSSISLQLSARALGRRIGLRDGVAICSAGNVAELLPLPGGALARGAALMQAGAGLGESAWIVTLGAVMMLAMSAALAALPLALAGSPAAYPFGAGGIAGTLAAAGWIARRAGVRIAAAMVAVRVALLGTAVLQITASFAALGVATGPAPAALYAVSSTLATAATVVPAGLGLAEGLAAALALLVAAPPAAAFVAMALTRASVLAVSAAVAVLWAAQAARGAGR